MCTTNIYSYLHPDGRRETVQQPNLCRHSRHGKPCPDNVVFQLPSQFVGSSSAPAGASYLGGSQLPPSPSYTPRSGTPNYHSGNESDRSHHSGSSRSSKKHGSGIYVSVNGQKVVDLERSRDRQGRERIVLVDAPRTPPQSYSAPPPAPYIVDAPRERSASRHRPIIVNDRPYAMEPPAIKHTRHSSASSHESRRSHHSSHSDDEERERRREQRREQRRREERELKVRERIAEANKRINSRPAAPTPPAPPRFVRPAVHVTDPEADLAEAVRQMRIAEAAREEDAQQQRLRERMQPKRRATVSNGSRRTKVLYENGVYQWE
jgi:hypothetical protein